jgi:cytochrome b6-f complex iron-sulfur subunit
MTEQPEHGAADDNLASLDRRRFVKAGTTSLALAGVGACVFGFRYLSPNVLYEPSPIISMGRPERYAVGSVTLDLRSSIFIVRIPDGFYAVSAVCTHLGCLSDWRADKGEIACPCHGSRFARDGAVISGPAPKPLPWLKMWISDDGVLMVDRSATVPAHSEYVRA